MYQLTKVKPEYENFDDVIPVVETSGYRTAYDQIISILEAGERLYDYRHGYYTQSGIQNEDGSVEYEGDEDEAFAAYDRTLSPNYDLSDYTEDMDYLEYARRKNHEKKGYDSGHLSDRLDKTSSDNDVSSGDTEESQSKPKAAAKRAVKENAPDVQE